MRRKISRFKRATANIPSRRKGKPVRRTTATAFKKRIGRKAWTRRRGRPIARNTSRTTSQWNNQAYDAGCQAANAALSPETEGMPGAAETNPHRKVNRHWYQWVQSVQRLPRSAYTATASKFMDGYFRQTGGYPANWLLVPTARTIAVIVTVMNEKDTIPRVLEQLHRLPLHEMIFVVNGSTDESFEIIRNQSRATIVHYHEPLGHDVGRAIGAKLAESEILIFLDGDFPVLAEQLVPFVDAIEKGMDVALNDISPYLGVFSGRDQVTRVKEFVNRSMSRADLGANSLTAIPHAISKQAIERIGYAQLAVPPKAQVIAIAKGLKVGTPASVDVISRNRVREHNVGPNNAVAKLIIGDHVEALREALELRGTRLSFPDHIRRREAT